MPEILSLVWLVPVFPLLAFAAIVFLTHPDNRLSAWTAIAGIGLSTLVGLAIFATALGMPTLAEKPFHVTFPWIPTGTTQLVLGFMVDPLTAVMLAMVTVVCTAIFVYSQGYMDKDPRYARFFAYISLFASGMLGLVTADNLLILYLSWEIMGLCSYLLIGFWFERPAAANAAKKAFLTTRVGDVLLFIGLIILYFQTGSLSFEDIFSQLAFISAPLLVIVGLLIFAGAVGKSAQFPLHVWLPDAMEGPTPVSALIHAATMVAAGVYLVARTYPLFAAVQGGPALLWVGGIGAFTALFAASIAVAQNDIKRVLAYSTISQLGYMMAALGVGGFVASIFHLITHAFFKALLFLGAGSVIHAMHTNDMFEMGGLRRRMPITFWTLTAGALALAGIPPFAGFWSKDEILAEAFLHNPLIWLVLTLTGLVTAFYIARLIFLTFFGPERRREVREVEGTRFTLIPHESPRVMTAPLVSLASMVLLVGLAGVPTDFPVLGPLLGSNPFHHFLGQNFARFGIEFEAIPFNASVPVLNTSLAAALLGLFIGWWLYGRQPLRQAQPDPLERLGPIHKLLKNKYYVDELYNATLVRGLVRLSEGLGSFDLRVIDGLVNLAGRGTAAFSELNRLFDVYVVDGAVNGVGSLTRWLGRGLREIQTGQVQNYLLVLALSTLLLAAVLINVMFTLIAILVIAGVTILVWLLQPSVEDRPEERA